MQYLKHLMGWCIDINSYIVYNPPSKSCRSWTILKNIKVVVVALLLT